MSRYDAFVDAARADLGLNFERSGALPHTFVFLVDPAAVVRIEVPIVVGEYSLLTFMPTRGDRTRARVVFLAQRGRYGQEEKERMDRSARLVAAAYSAVAVVSCMEAWATYREKGGTFEVRPSEDPERREVLYCSAEGHGEPSRMAYAQILRPDGPPMLGPWSGWEEGRSAGLWQGLLS